METSQLCRVLLLAVIAVVGQSLSIDEIARRQSQLTMDTFEFFQEQIQVQQSWLEENLRLLEARVSDLEARESPAVPGAGHIRPGRPDEPGDPGRQEPSRPDQGDTGNRPQVPEPEPEPEPEPKPKPKTTTRATTTIKPTTTPAGPEYDRTCAEIFNHGYIYTSEYTIDPDGEGPVSPFTVFCDMEEGAGVTKVGHDREQENIAVNGFEEPGSFVLQPLYANGATMEQLGALADASAECEQWVKYACKSSNLMGKKPGTQESYAWWVDRTGLKQVNFGGAPTNSEKCGCFYAGPDKSNACYMDSETCNCDHKKAKNKVDEGYFTDKDRLPVMSINLGDTGSKKERGAITLGKFICRG